MPTRILIVDDHQLVRQSIRTLLEEFDAVEVVGEASNGREAIKQVDELLPDLVIMDVTMPELNGLQAAEIIKRRDPKTAIVVFSIHNFGKAAQELGLNGFVTKTDSGETLLEAITAVQNHQTYFAP